MSRVVIGALFLTVIVASSFRVMTTFPESFYRFSSAQTSADDLVKQLRELPTPLPAMGRTDGMIDPIEQRRRDLYRQLWSLGDNALPALARGLSDPDVRIRRNVALFLNVLAGGWVDYLRPKVNIGATLQALVAALNDSDPSVRGWSAQAIGEIGPDAAEAIPALLTLLKDENEGARNSACIALRGIGPAAKAALPALREALSDPSTDVRRFAAQAIDKIEGR